MGVPPRSATACVPLPPHLSRSACTRCVRRAQVGTDRGAGYNINIPWDGPGAGDAEYAAAFDDVIMPVAQAYAPDLVLVSAGFDAARGDPLGGCDLTPAGYAYMTSRLLSLAGGRLVVALEGGYNLTSISRGMEAVLRVMLGQAPPHLHALPSRTHTGGGPAAAGASSAAATAAYLDAITARANGGGSSDRDPAAAAAGAAGAGAAAVGGSSSSSSSLPRQPPPPPRADVFEPTALAAADVESTFEGVDRAGILQQVAPMPSALRAIASTLAAHAPYWPVLHAKHRAYQRLVQAELAARAAAAPGAGAAFSSSDEDGHDDGDDDGEDDDVDDAQAGSAQSGGAADVRGGSDRAPRDDGTEEEGGSGGDEEGDDDIVDDDDEDQPASAKRARTSAPGV